MNPLLPKRFALVLALSAGLPAALCAADWQSLLGNSPFGVSAAAPAGATGDLEFRGVVQEEGVYLVNLYNPTTKTSQWLPVKGKAPGLEVKSYDASADNVQITQAGRALTLPLKQAHVSLLAANAPKDGEEKGGDDQEARRQQIRDAMRARMQPGPDGQPSPFMRNLPPEAQAMIDEYRRRRAENAANANGNGDPSQAQTPAQGQRRNRGGGGQQP